MNACVSLHNFLMSKLQSANIEPRQRTRMRKMRIIKSYRVGGNMTCHLPTCWTAEDWREVAHQQQQSKINIWSVLHARRSCPIRMFLDNKLQLYFASPNILLFLAIYPTVPQVENTVNLIDWCCMLMRLFCNDYIPLLVLTISHHWSVIWP